MERRNKFENLTCEYILCCLFSTVSEKEYVTCIGFLDRFNFFFFFKNKWHPLFLSWGVVGCSSFSTKPTNGLGW